jgi:hypothetical protein
VALSGAAGEYALVFEPLNEAGSGKPVIVNVWRAAAIPRADRLWVKSAHENTVVEFAKTKPFKARFLKHLQRLRELLGGRDSARRKPTPSSETAAMPASRSTARPPRTRLRIWQRSKVVTLSKNVNEGQKIPLSPLPLIPSHKGRGNGISHQILGLLFSTLPSVCPKTSS